jgi:virginiamycin B lyase
MRIRSLLLIVTAALAVILYQAGSTALRGETTGAAALTGQVSSADEGAMEGVLVTAKKTGSTISITVVSDETGRYRFPAGKLEPGQYSLRMRAVGYEMDDPGVIDTAAGKTATADLKLRKAKDLTTQLTNSEWMQSIPGTADQKGSLLNCVQCHTVERIVKSKHDADQFMQTLTRMGGWANQSVPARPQRRLAERMLEEKGDTRNQNRRKQAEFLATINLSSNPTFAYDLKTAPRPKGRATHVIVTEYDLPRKLIEPHDVILDAEGNAWYSNFGEQNIGKLDPKTGKVTEYATPELKKDWPKGGLGLQMDENQNIWLGMMYQAAVAKFDPKTEKFQTISAPQEFNREMTQINMVEPQHSSVDGKVWTQNNGFAIIHRIDLASGNIETFQPFKDSKSGETAHNIYDVIPDSHNNAYFTDFANEHIGRVDAKTGEIKLYTIPTKRSAPRRGQMDSQDRLWFGEYKGNRIGMFDTKTERFQEWEMPTPYSAPYDVTLDKNGEAWTGSMSSDRVARLDPKTGKITEYLLPRSTNIRRVFVDNTTTPVTFWVGSNHGGSIVKVEPLD